MPGGGAQLVGAPDAPGLASCATPGLAPTASTERTVTVATAASLRTLFEMSTAITLLNSAMPVEALRCQPRLVKRQRYRLTMPPDRLDSRSRVAPEEDAWWCVADTGREYIDRIRDGTTAAYVDWDPEA